MLQPGGVEGQIRRSVALRSRRRIPYGSIESRRSSTDDMTYTHQQARSGGSAGLGNLL